MKLDAFDRFILRALVAVLVLLVLFFALDLLATLLGFDGKIGAGCDRGNPNCA